MTAEEIEIIRRAVEATKNHFWLDFSTRLVVELEEINSLLESWPQVDDSDDGSLACNAIFHSLYDVTHCAQLSESEINDILGTTRARLMHTYYKWIHARHW